jgi:hypothetical protein
VIEIIHHISIKKIFKKFPNKLPVKIFRLKEMSQKCRLESYDGLKCNKPEHKKPEDNGQINVTVNCNGSNIGNGVGIGNGNLNGGSGGGGGGDVGNNGGVISELQNFRITGTITKSLSIPRNISITLEIDNIGDILTENFRAFLSNIFVGCKSILLEPADGFTFENNILTYRGLIFGGKKLTATVNASGCPACLGCCVNNEGCNIVCKYIVDTVPNAEITQVALIAVKP